MFWNFDFFKKYSYLVKTPNISFAKSEELYFHLSRVSRVGRERSEKKKARGNIIEIKE